MNELAGNAINVGGVLRESTREDERGQRSRIRQRQRERQPCRYRQRRRERQRRNRRRRRRGSSDCGLAHGMEWGGVSGDHGLGGVSLNGGVRGRGREAWKFVHEDFVMLYNICNHLKILNLSEYVIF